MKTDPKIINTFSSTMLIRALLLPLILSDFIFFFQAEDGIRDRSPSRGLGDVYKRQVLLLFLQYIHQRFSVPMEIALTTPLGEQSPRKRKIVGSSPTGSL